MSMNGRGLSLFQGSDSIKIDTSLNRLEEEEALEDQKRRNEELGNQLQNAFDDLNDDEDYTAETSAQFNSHLSNGNAGDQQQRKESQQLVTRNLKALSSHIENGQGDDRNFSLEVEKLHRLVESRVREIENLTKIIHDERKRNDDLKKRLALSEAEKERAHMHRKQTHELLVESKAKISELEDSTEKGKLKLKSLEEANNELVGELERTKTMLSDAHQKYRMIERNFGVSSDRHTDALLKQSNERHNAQMELLNQQLESLRSKLEDKEQELKTLNIRYKEIQKSRESLMIEKAETINQLSRSLEDSQRQCQQLMSKPDFSHENLQLQRFITALEKQADDMEKTIRTLQTKLDAANSELQIMDSLVGGNGDISETLRRLSATAGNFIGNTPVQPDNSDRINKLKNELYRSMSGQKAKREEIKRLQDEIAMKCKEIKKHKNDENIMLIDLQTCKDEKLRLENRLKILETELDALRNSNISKNVENSTEDNQRRKIQQLEDELKTSKTEYNILNERLLNSNQEYDKLKSELLNLQNSDKNSRKLRELEIDLEELRQEYENLKRNYEQTLQENEQLKCESNQSVLKLELEKQKFLLKDSQNECDRLKNLYVEISAAKDCLAQKLTILNGKDLNKELYVQREKCVNLERALQLSEIKCEELEKILDEQRKMSFEEIEEMKKKFAKENSQSLKAAKNSSNHCTKCIDSLSEITKLEINNLKQEAELTNTKKELENCKEQLKDSNETIASLTKSLNLKEDRDQMIEDLKMKAKHFEEYIKLHSASSKETSSGVCSPKNTIESRDQSVETSPELVQNYNRRQLEARIRDEMAKIFAIEIKNIEEKSKNKLSELESINSSQKLDMHKISYELELRQNEVDTLKHVILREREKVKEILEKKDLDARQIFDKQNSILQRCRDELKSKQARIENLVKELDERSSQIEAERKSMKVVMQQWEEQINRKVPTEQEWISKLDEIRNEHTKFVEQIQAKYHSAKKTAANYKKYAEDKEKHMMQEYDRIKFGYENSLAKIESRMREILEKQNQEMKERIHSIESSYELKLKNLQTELEK